MCTVNSWWASLSLSNAGKDAIDAVKQAQTDAESVEREELLYVYRVLDSPKRDNVHWELSVQRHFYVKAFKYMIAP